MQGAIVTSLSFDKAGDEDGAEVVDTVVVLDAGARGVVAAVIVVSDERHH